MLSFEEYADILGLFGEISAKHLKVKVLELDRRETFEQTVNELKGMGVFSEEMLDLPLPVRLQALMELAKGEGAVAFYTATVWTKEEFGLKGFSPVFGGRLQARTEEGDGGFSPRAKGRFTGEEVEVLGLRGLTWMQGDFHPEGDVPPGLGERFLTYLIAVVIGVAFASHEEALTYSQERKAFGRPVYEYGEIKGFLDRGLSALEASRSGLLDGRPVVYQALDSALFVADKAVQIFGGYGYIAEYPVSKFFRDVRMLRSLIPAAQVQG